NRIRPDSTSAAYVFRITFESIFISMPEKERLTIWIRSMASIYRQTNVKDFSGSQITAAMIRRIHGTLKNILR
ncbi:MAG: hypothetical protein IKE81_02490, partial [Clostridia bacterium]|nr:hypothetical protein [Clostridia bacterium]